MGARPLNIAIVVPGRFHAFELARELIRQGAAVTVLTNYPKGVAERFGLPPPRVRSLVGHGVVSRVAQTFGWGALALRLEPRLHRWFSRWAARTLRGLGELDAIHCFSGVAEEILDCFRNASPLCSLVRGSAHILAQARLLAAEERRCGCPLHQPSGWMIAREMREYDSADLVVVLSSFAARTFCNEGFPREKLRILPLGSDVRQFRPDLEALRERCRRVLSGQRLRVLTVGAFTFQKGVYDLAQIARRLDGPFQFKFVGDCPHETDSLRAECRDVLQFVPRQPQALLPRHYAESDLFVFTTIQDGYAAVLAQAHAAGLPILTTAHCAGSDLVREGETGWVFPIHSPEAFIERLRWCDAHREHLATMVRRAYDHFHPRDWSEVASDLQGIFREAMQSRAAIPL